MAGMGRPPKPRSEKRRPNSGTFAKVDRILPPHGRTGPPPDWPFPNPTEAELTLWTDLWHTPQAAAWEKLGWTRVVARYVRDLLEAEQPRAIVALKSEVRQAEDRLGLTPMSMLRLRWEIGEADVEKQTGAGGKATVTRLRAVEAK